MNFDDMRSEINEKVEAFLETLESVSAEDLGFDRRACYSGLLVNRDLIAITKSESGGFNYYGGMEYVSASHVVELGDYVFYKRLDEDGEECSRIAGHLSRKFEDLEEQCDEEDEE